MASNTKQQTILSQTRTVQGYDCTRSEWVGQGEDKRLVFYHRSRKVTYLLEIDQKGIESLAFRAARQKGKRSVDGPVTIKALDVVDGPEEVSR